MRLYRSGDEVCVVSAHFVEAQTLLQGVVVAKIAVLVRGNEKSSCNVVVMTHFFFGLDILTLLVWIEFKSSITDATLHCAIEIVNVLWCHDEAIIIEERIDCLFLDLAHTQDEPLPRAISGDYAIRFVELG